MAQAGAGPREAKAPCRLVDRKIGNGTTAYLARYGVNTFFTWVCRRGPNEMLEHLELRDTSEADVKVAVVVFIAARSETDKDFFFFWERRQ